MKKRATLVFIFLTAIAIQHVFSQTAYRSITSGAWSDFNTWERTTNVYNPTPTWVPAVSGQAPTSNNIVYVRSGHTVLLDASKSCLNLIVEAGGKLWSAGGAFNVRVGTSSSSISGTIDTARIDGILGDPAGDAIGLNLGSPCASLWVTGTGTINIGRIRAETGNTNNPAGIIAGHADEAKWLIDKDMTLNVGNYAYSIPNSTQAATDTITLTLNSGRTVTVANPAGYFHNATDSSGTFRASVTGGRYVYNINGVLDLTANTSITGGTKLYPFGNLGSLLALNVNGVMKLGGYFKADTLSNSVGSIRMTIGNGGMIDASLTSKLITGTVNAQTETPNIFFVETGSGVLKRTVPNDGTKVIFDIGTSLTSYTPVTISSTIGPADTYTVNVKNTFDHTPPAQTIMKQWTIAEGTVGANIDTLRFAWTTADEAGSGFVHGGQIYILQWNGLAWVNTPASISGSGTLADPWVAKGAAFSTFSQFAVSSLSAIVQFKWTGTVSTDWSVGLNWSTGVPPTVADDIFIPSGTPFSPVIKSGYIGHCKSVTVNSGAFVTVATGGDLKVGL